MNNIQKQTPNALQLAHGQLGSCFITKSKSFVFSLKAVPRCCWNPAWYYQLLMPEKSQWNKRFILDRSCHSEAKMTFISRAYTMTGVIFRTWQQELSKVEWNCSNGARRASFEAAKQHAMLHGPFKLYSKTECNMVLCVS